MNIGGAQEKEGLRASEWGITCHTLPDSPKISLLWMRVNFNPQQRDLEMILGQIWHVIPRFEALNKFLYHGISGLLFPCAPPRMPIDLRSKRCVIPNVYHALAGLQGVMTLRTPRTVEQVSRRGGGERTRTPTKPSQPKRSPPWTSTNHPHLISTRSDHY